MCVLKKECLTWSPRGQNEENDRGSPPAEILELLHFDHKITEDIWGIDVFDFTSFSRAMKSHKSWSCLFFKVKAKTWWKVGGFCFVFYIVVSVFFFLLLEHLTPRMLGDEVNPLSLEKNPEKLRPSFFSSLLLAARSANVPAPSPRLSRADYWSLEMLAFSAWYSTTTTAAASSTKNQPSR